VAYLKADVTSICSHVTSAESPLSITNKFLRSTRVALKLSTHLTQQLHEDKYGSQNKYNFLFCRTCDNAQTLWQQMPFALLRIKQRDASFGASVAREVARITQR
jgi:hypothetical protein